MYQVYCDSFLLFDDRLENLKIFDPKVELELNKTGSFTFSIYPDHPYFNQIKKLKSIITVYQDDFLLFRGRILNDEIGFYNEKDVECEGELAFLLDSIIRPYEFSGSIEGFLQKLITEHNAQVDAAHQFALGNVTVTDPNNTITRSSVDYSKTLDVINKSLLDLLGGYIRIRVENNVKYIDFISDFSTLSSQAVDFGKNLLDIKRIRKGEEIATALIPLGSKLEGSDQRLTIASVNGGVDYIFNQAAVDQYGWIFQTATWDDVTLASNLLTKGQAYLDSIVNQDEIIELSAADLATIDSSVTSFHIGTYVDVSSNPHEINQRLLVSKISIDLLNPGSNKLTLGGVVQSLTEKTAKIDFITEDSGITRSMLASAVYNLERNIDSSISQSESNILATVSESYYLKDETDSLVSSVSTQIEQTAESFEIQFNRFSADIADVAAGADAEFEAIKKYIRFVDGMILLGEIGNELELQISNDKISFIQDGSEVAYFSNHKLFVTDGEYTNSLRLGSFSFIPRNNGNLSFKKVT